MIAEDLSYNQQVIIEICKQLHCESRVLNNGLDLVEEYLLRHMNVTAILTDINMPKMDGISAIAAIREIERNQNLPEVPIIVLTGNATLKNRMAAKRAGCSEFLVKPLQFDELARCLAEFRETTYTIILIEKDKFSL